MDSKAHGGVTFVMSYAISSTPAVTSLNFKYRKSPTYERVPFQECVCKSNLFLSPTKLA